MVPNKFNMIDLDGLDIIESQGVIVPGLYDKLVESIALCHYQCIYNWKFNSIPIPPTYVELDIKSDGVWINDGIVVSEDDTIHIYSIEPEPDPPVINPLNVVSNGIYNVSEGVDGFNPVSVQVPPPVIEPLEVSENGIYNLPSGVNGFAPVTVNVSTEPVDDWTDLKNYIESNGTQYINTGYSPASNTKFEVIADVPDNTTSYPALIGERTSLQNEVVIYAEFNGGNLGLVWANGDGVATSDNVRQYYIGNKCKYVLGGDGLRGVLNENEYGFLYVKEIGTFATLPIFIFVLNDNGTPNSITYCSAKLYRFRIYEGDTLLHEYLPWQESGVACLKDTVSGVILYNAGTGNFVYGTDQ